MVHSLFFIGRLSHSRSGARELRVDHFLVHLWSTTGPLSPFPGPHGDPHSPAPCLPQRAHRYLFKGDPSGSNAPTPAGSTQPSKTDDLPPGGMETYLPKGMTTYPWGATSPASTPNSCNTSGDNPQQHNHQLGMPPEQPGSAFKGLTATSTRDKAGGACRGSQKPLVAIQRGIHSTSITSTTTSWVGGVTGKRRALI